jgi:hypothetical protein
MMGAIDVVENLIQAGVAMKDAWTAARKTRPSLTWEEFLGTPEFTGGYEKISGVLKKVTQSEVEKAIDTVHAKKKALLGGLSVIQLSTDKLAQYDALLDVENQLVRKYAANASKSAEWVSWIIDDALPDLVKVAKIVIPLLL